ncbi:hypothetical protein Tco_1132252 [Tanacetum coccineum]|uniref:Uncharacterized protein n=1 Tax=Tanacetum coccineum TaxID=301880 RepID=A0ABQ5JC19_9ASTR
MKLAELFSVTITKVIKKELEKLGFIKINDDLFACNTPLRTLFDEFNRLSGIDDDLFTYKVVIPELASIPRDPKEEDDSDNGDLDIYEPRVCYDENDRIYAEAVIFVNKKLVRLMDVTVEQWLDLIYGDHKTVDVKIKNEVVSNWLTRGDNEVEFTNTESFDPDDENLIEENEVAEIFRIETNVFDFEKPTYRAFNWKNDGYCNGENLPGAYIVGNILRYQDLEWYEASKDGKLKDKALKNKAIMEGIIDEEEESNNEV